MKRLIPALVCALAIVHASGALAAVAEDPILVPLTHVSSDAAPGMSCDLQLGLSPANEILGLEYDCQGSDRYQKFFPIEKIRQGSVLFHYDRMNVDVITISGPNLDAVHGGPVVIRYLSNFLKGEYKNWEATIEPLGAKWTAYTSPGDGHRAFNNIFAVKRTVLGQLVGIQEIRASWVNIRLN
jgi:hypothetical protein